MCKCPSPLGRDCKNLVVIICITLQNIVQATVSVHTSMLYEMCSPLAHSECLCLDLHPYSMMWTDKASMVPSLLPLMSLWVSVFQEYVKMKADMDFKPPLTRMGVTYGSWEKQAGEKERLMGGVKVKCEGCTYRLHAFSCLPGSGHPLNSALGTERACKRDREEKGV